MELLGLHYHPTFSSSSPPEGTNALKFLARPYLINVTPWAATGIPATLVGQYYIPFQLTQIPTWNNHVNGYYGARFTVKARIQFATSPFTGGIYKLVFIPTCVNVHAYINTQTKLSKFPGVYLDVSESTMVELTVPWLSVFDFAPSNTSDNFPGTDYYGAFQLFTYTTINNPAGNTAPTASMFISFHDVQLIGSSPTNATYTAFTPQAGSEDRVVDKPLSTMLFAASTIARYAGRTIPLISSIATPVAWWTRYIAGVASSYGFSKPLFTNPTSRMQVTTNCLQQNSDTADTSASLALTMGNELALMPGFAGSDVDEMALLFVVTKFAAIARFSIAVTDVANTVKYGCRLGPAYLYYYNNSPNNTYSIYSAGSTITQKLAVQPSYITYISNAFAFWKGDLIFRFMSNKTKFHAGRLFICFLPLTDDATPGGTILSVAGGIPSLQDTHSAVWDLRGANSFEFCCPYTAAVKYLGQNMSFGNLLVYILDPLIAASTVSSSVEFSVLVRGADNFEFAMPITPQITVANFSSVLTGQAGATICVIPGTTRDDDCVYTMGERITSIKQLIMKSCSFANITTPTSSRPRSWYTFQQTSYGASSMNPTPNPFCNYFALPYLYARGSTHFDFLTNSGSDTATNSVVALYDNPYVPYTNYQSANSIQMEPTNLHVRLPYYNTTPRDFVRDYTIAATPTRILPTSQNILVYYNRSGSMSIRAGDDAQLGFLWGTPTLALEIVGAPRPYETNYTNLISTIT